MKRLGSIIWLLGGISLWLGIMTSCNAPATLAPQVPVALPTLSPQEIIATNVAIQQAIAATLTAQPADKSSATGSLSSPTPTFTSTPSMVVTPSSTPLLQEEPTLTPPPRINVPVLLKPAQGGTYKAPITFQWRGKLEGTDKYQVRAYHVETGYILMSDLLTESIWTTDMPASKVGEWRWTVSVVRNGILLTKSAEWAFWFDPFPRTPRAAPGTPGVAPTPTTGPYP
jgi:hypothetical protein